MVPVEYATSSEARKNFKEVLDATDVGLLVTIQREQRTSAVVDAALLRTTLFENLPARVSVVAEGDGWSAFMDGMPVSAEGATFDEAVDELVDALRDYVEDWEDHLRLAPNHQQHWPVVQLARLSDDDVLRHWLTKHP